MFCSVSTVAGEVVGRVSQGLSLSGFGASVLLDVQFDHGAIARLPLDYLHVSFTSPLIITEIGEDYSEEYSDNYSDDGQGDNSSDDNSSDGQMNRKDFSISTSQTVVRSSATGV